MEHPCTWHLLCSENETPSGCARFWDFLQALTGPCSLPCWLIVLTGILTGFQGHWWRYGWIWVSLVLLIGISAAMMPLGRAIYGAIRQALEQTKQVTGQEASAEPSKSPEEIDALLKKANPIRLAVIGYGGLAILAWLMIFKPF